MSLIPIPLQGQGGIRGGGEGLGLVLSVVSEGVVVMHCFSARLFCTYPPMAPWLVWFKARRAELHTME